MYKIVSRTEPGGETYSIGIGCTKGILVIHMQIKWLDGVRVYGLFLVLGYHLFYRWFPGGFLGVDIFFTISGFLITVNIIEEIQKKNNFSLHKFLKRRFLRIMVPLFYAVIFTLPLLILVPPDISVGIAKQTIATLTLTTNWFEIFSGNSYESRLIPSIYLHTWSLAVSMQFYIIWGIICAFVMRLMKFIISAKLSERFAFFKWAILIISVISALMSFLYMQFLFTNGVMTDTIYFNTFARFFPFAFGSMAAAVIALRSSACNNKRTIRNTGNKASIIAVICICVISASVILYGATQYAFSDALMHRYGFLFAALLTAVLILLTNYLSRATPLYIKEPRPIKALAGMSFNIYLYHWPFYIIFSALIFEHMQVAVLTLAVTLFFSALMYYRVDKVKIFERKNILGKFVAGAVIISMVLGGTAVYRAPAITSIEADFIANYVNHDVEHVFYMTQKLLSDNAPSIIVSSEVDIGIEEAAAKELPKEQPLKKVEPPIEETPPDKPDPTEGIPLDDVPYTYDNITIIGDSVLLGAQSAIMELLPNSTVNASIGRSVKDGLALLIEMQELNELGEYIVVAFGTNGTKHYESLFTKMIEAVNPGQKLILVTPFDGRDNANAQETKEITAWMRTLPEIYDFITIADWSETIGSQVKLLAVDKVHLRGQDAANLYADCIMAALENADT